MTYDVDHDPGAPFPWRIVRTREVRGDAVVPGGDVYHAVTIREVFAHFRTADDARAYADQCSKRKP